MDELIAQLASRQQGVVARYQLLAVGIAESRITWRLRTGRLHEVHRGVYLVGHTARSAHAHEIAALLACRGRAAISHRSALALWELLSYSASAPVHVTMRPGRTTCRHGIQLHRAVLERRDMRRLHGMRVTTPARAILDSAAELGWEGQGRPQGSARLSDLERVVADAAYRGLAGDAELREQVERNPRKRGVASLRRVIELPGGPRRTRSPAERELLELLRAAGVDGYEVNARIHGYEVDFLWREERLAVEVDGYAAHSGRVAFERDRLKVATLEAHGVSVMPITGRQLRREPTASIACINAALRHLRQRGRS